MGQKIKKTSLNVTLSMEARLHMLMIKQDSETHTNITYKAEQSNIAESVPVPDTNLLLP